MPQITVVLIVIVAAALLLGMVIAWVVRGKRSTAEKAAINLGWQEQLAAQNNEHGRLLEQNKSLMEQNGQYQASNKDSKMRASELSASLREAFERRDELQRQIKDIRNNLEATVAQRNRLQSDMQNREVEDDVTSIALKKRDEEIAKLKKDLAAWQQRVPPLVERFRIRNDEATALLQELLQARDRIVALEAMIGSDQTRVDPVDPDALGDNLNASNDAEDFGEEDEYVATSASADDDLMQIKGVGPAIAKTLHELGIFRFAQIAEMNEYDIDRVAARLKGFRSRIYREDWIGQARALLDQKHSGSV